MTQESNESSSNHNHVYVRSKEEAWLPARLLQVKDKEALVQVALPSKQGQRSSYNEKWTVSLEDYPNHALPLQNCDSRGTVQLVPDMIDLPHLHEAAILFNLKERHANKQPYTRTGDIVIAVNPYQWMSHYYTKERRAEYSEAIIQNNRPVRELAPHVYEVSALAYKGLQQHGKNQSILVSGESGAGKTETVKICLGHIASISESTNNNHQNSTVVQRVLDSNPLLEAFGNAQTTRNDNSSRFGKYLQLQFDAQAKLAGSQCQVYLLEKSRVVHHSVDERTYHIFYELLAAPETTKAAIWKGLENTTNESFKYVGPASIDAIEGVSDADRFQQTVDSLQLLGVQGSTLRHLWRALCVVLQLGNLTFLPDPNDSECAVFENTADLEALAQLLGFSSEKLQKALLERKIEARGEVMSATVSAGKAKEACDALAKEIYHRTFLWLVQCVNDATSCAAAGGNTIGLLDIFGFESFETNGFEQLCINYANEKLQQKFTNDIFRTVMAEYHFEGIQLEEITYDDNTDVLELIEGRTGLLAMLNEECFRPNGHDAAFVNKAVAQNKASPCLIVEHVFDEYEFGIRHYAGEVVYRAETFVAKNRDTIPSDLKEVALTSTNEIISLSITTDNNTKQMASKAHHPWAQKQQTGRAYRLRSSNIVGEGVWSKFKTQLKGLMETLEDTQTRYIRCIKPNSSKAPLIMEHTTTVEQLRCAGVVAAVTISRSAFPNRLEHEHVLDRFRSLWPKGTEMCAKGDLDEQNLANVEILLNCALQGLETKKGKKTVKAFVVGRTRTYFRAGALEHLDAERMDGMALWATDIQRIFRGVRQYRRYQQQRAAAIRIEANMRRYLAQRWYQHLRQCVAQIQSRQRANTARRLLVELRVQRDAAISIQRVARGKVQRRRYRQALQDKKDEANMILQMQKMQKQIEEAEQRRKEELDEEKRAQIKVLQVQLKDVEKRRQEDLQRERDQARQKMEADKVAMLETEQKRAEEAKLRMLEEEQKRFSDLDEMHKREVDAQKSRYEEREIEREAARQKFELEQRSKLDDERKKLQDEICEERKRMNDELRELRAQKAYYEQKYYEAEEKAAVAAARPVPEPEVKIVEVVKIVEREVKPTGPTMTEAQKKLMEESGKIIEFLRNENLKLRKKTEQQKKDFEAVKENNERLMEANASASQSFQSINQHAKQLNGSNQRLTTTVAQYRHKIGELHSEIKHRQTYYREIAEAYKAETDARIFYEQAMLEIVDCVSANECDPSIHSLVMAKAMECAKTSSRVAGVGILDMEDTESSLLEM